MCKMGMIILTLGDLVASRDRTWPPAFPNRVIWVHLFISLGLSHLYIDSDDRYSPLGSEGNQSGDCLSDFLTSSDFLIDVSCETVGQLSRLCNTDLGKVSEFLRLQSQCGGEAGRVCSEANRCLLLDRKTGSSHLPVRKSTLPSSMWENL